MEAIQHYASAAGLTTASCDKLSMRGTLIPVRRKRLFDSAIDESRRLYFVCRFPAGARFFELLHPFL